MRGQRSLYTVLLQKLGLLAPAKKFLNSQASV